MRLVDLGRFPFRQNFRLDRFNCKLNAQFDRKFFRNKRATFRGIPLFPFQPVGTEISDLFAQFWFGRRLAPGIFPPFPVFAGKGCSRAVTVFLFISYRIVQNGICICRLKIVLNSVRISSGKTATNCCYWAHRVKVIFARCCFILALFENYFFSKIALPHP